MCHSQKNLAPRACIPLEPRDVYAFCPRHVLEKIMRFQKFPIAVLVLLHVCEQVCKGSLDLLEVVRALAGIILARNPSSFLPLEESLAVLVGMRRLF